MSQEVQGMLIQLEATTAQLRREMASADDVVARTTRQIDRNLVQVDDAFDRTARGAQQAGTLIRGAFAAIAGAGLVGGLIKQIDSVGQMNDRMRELTGSSAEYDQVQSRLLQTAKQTYRPLQEAQELYLLTADSIKGMGYNTQQALDITDSFSYLLVTNASSADKARSALDAYSKSLMTGKVGADEWRSILSAMPTVVNALADATGNSVEEIKRLGIEGKLSLDELNNGFLKTVEANREAAARMRASVTDALVNINTALGVYLGKAEESGGAAAALADVMGHVAEKIGVVAALVGGVASASLVNYTAKLVLAGKATYDSIGAAVLDRQARQQQAAATLQAAIAEQRKAETSVLLAAREAVAARGTAVQTQMSIQLAQARQREAAATLSVAAAQTGLRTASTGLLAVLGGPMGLALLAGTAAASFLLLRDNAEEAASKLPDLAAGVDQVREAFKKLGKAEQQIELNRLSQQVDKEKDAAIASLAELREAYANALYGPSGNRAPTAEAEAALGRLNQAMAQAQQGVAVNWLEIAESMKGVRGISETLVDKTLAVAGSQEASARAVGELTGRQLLLTGVLQENTAAQVENNAAQSGMSKSAADYIAAIEKRTAAVRDGNDPIAQANRHIQEHGKYTEEEAAAILKAAAAQKSAQDERTKSTAGRKASTKSITDETSAIDALIAKYDPAAKAQKTYADGMALADAQYKANKISAEQYQKVVQGLWAELNKPIWDKHNKEADEAAQRIKAVDDAVQGVLDRLDPAATAARKYAAEQKSINDAMREHPERIEEYRVALEKLGIEYKENTKATSEWTRWTESSLERVDSAFADAWRNIGDGFSGFRDSLTNAFKQMLAELAHMAITKPIIMQIGASLGIGGGSSGGGLLSSVMGGGSGGGMDFGKILNYGQSIYSGLTGVGPAVLAGYQSGGIGGALSGGAGYYGNLAGNAASTVGGWFGMGGGAAASSAAGSTAAGYTGSAYSAWAAGQGGAGAGAGLSGLGALAGPAAAAFAALQAYKAYGDGVRLDAKDTRGNAAAWATGYQPLAEISGAVSKLTEALGIGGALGNILNIPSTLTAMVGSALFGGGWETKNAGLAFGVAGGDLKAQSYEDQKKKGGLFSSSKKRTRYKNLDAETDLAFQDMFQSTKDSVAEMFEALGLSVEESSLDGLNVARQQISTKGKTDEQIQTAIGEWFGTVSEAMNTELNKVFNTGLGLDLAGMQAFVGNLSGVNAALEAINLTAYESSVAGGKLAVKLTEAAGGLEALAASTNTYYGAFFSEAEKVEDTLGAVQKAFSDSDVVLAGSRESYRKMVEDIDLTSDAGQRMFASMMGLAGQADTYYGILETRAAQAAQEAAQLAAVQAQAAALYYDQFTSPSKKASDAVASVVAQFEALELALPGTRGGFMAAVDALDKTSESGLKMFNTLMGVAGAADVYYDNLEARAAQSVTGAYSLLERSVAAEKSALTAAYTQEKAEQDALLQSRRESQAQAASARATAYTDMAQTASAMSSALSGLSSALSAAIGQLVDDSSSAVEQRRSVAVAQLQRALSSGDLSNADSLAEAAKVAASVDSGLYGSFDDLRREQGRTANMLLELGDISALRQTAADAQAEAMQRMAEQATNDAQSFRQSIGSVKTSVDMAYEAEIAALDEQLALGKSQIDALNGIDNSVMSVADAVSALTAAISAALSIIPGMSGISVPGFAAGGLHTGGLRLVGEHGPELEVTGPSRIYNASNTTAMLGGGETASEVRGLRKEVGDLRAYLYQIAKNTGNTATGIRQQNEIGIPEAV